MDKNLLLRNALAVLNGEDSPFMADNEALRRIHYAIENGEAGISAGMSENEAWRRILGAYQGESIAGMMGNREAQRRIIGELTGDLPFTQDENLLLVMLVENIAPLDDGVLEELTSDGSVMTADGSALTT